MPDVADDQRHASAVGVGDDSGRDLEEEHGRLHRRAHEDELERREVQLLHEVDRHDDPRRHGQEDLEDVVEPGGVGAPHFGFLPSTQRNAASPSGSAHPDELVGKELEAGLANEPAVRLSIEAGEEHLDAQPLLRPVGPSDMTERGQEEAARLQPAHRFWRTDPGAGPAARARTSRRRSRRQGSRQGTSSSAKSAWTNVAPGTAARASRAAPPRCPLRPPRTDRQAGRSSRRSRSRDRATLAPSEEPACKLVEEALPGISLDPLAPLAEARASAS